MSFSSPQAFIREKGNHMAKKFVEYQGVTFRLAPDKTVFICYNKQTCLPILPAFSNAVDRVETLALSSYLFDESNQNLSWVMKWLLKIHVRLGHLGINYV